MHLLIIINFLSLLDIHIIAPMEKIPGNPDVIEIGDDANDAELSDGQLSFPINILNFLSMINT